VAGGKANEPSGAPATATAAYELCAVVLHTGSTVVSGHYTALLADAPEPPLDASGRPPEPMAEHWAEPAAVPAVEDAADGAAASEAGEAASGGRRSGRQSGRRSGRWVLVDDSRAAWVPTIDAAHTLGLDSDPGLDGGFDRGMGHGAGHGAFELAEPPALLPPAPSGGDRDLVAALGALPRSCVCGAETAPLVAAPSRLKRPMGSGLVRCGSGTTATPYLLFYARLP